VILMTGNIYCNLSAFYPFIIRHIPASGFIAIEQTVFIALFIYTRLSPETIFSWLVKPQRWKSIISTHTKKNNQENTTDLQFCQRDDIAIMRPMPYRTLTGRVVIVEPRSLVIEQLPPLAV
jgi:hypothetical protein